MTGMQASTQAQLRQYIEKAERLDEEIRALKADFNDVFAEAKAVGFDPKIMKKVIALRRKDPNERTEEETLIDVYMHAVQGAFESKPYEGMEAVA